jgi:hypothetical protein
MAPKTSSRRTPSRTERREQALHRRRQQATARTAAARRSHLRKRRLKGGAAFVVLAVVVAGVVTLTRGGDDGPSLDLRAKKVSGASGLLAISNVPTAYRAVYRAEAYQDASPTVSTEEVLVQRPFDGKVSIREGEPPGAAAQFEGRSQFSVYANFSDANAAQIAGDAPTVALGDVRVDTSLSALVDDGLFVPGDRRRATLAGAAKGRECQAYRTGSPLQSLKITAPTATDYVEVCLDQTGLILEEVTIAAGKVAQRLTAVSLELDPTLDPAGFVIEGDRIGVDEGGSVVTEVDRTTAPAPGYWTLDTPPSGFTSKGRYLVAGAGSSYVDVYVRGIDIITVRQGAPDGEPDLSDAGPGKDVDLGPLGSGKLLLRSVGPTFVAHPGAEAFVHVTGTISPAELQSLATSLRKG